MNSSTARATPRLLSQLTPFVPSFFWYSSDGGMFVSCKMIAARSEPQARQAEMMPSALMDTICSRCTRPICIDTLTGHEGSPSPELSDGILVFVARVDEQQVYRIA
jgi:hypothetical protein